MLTCETAAGGVCDVYLVGTTHVSEKSSQHVQAVIEFLKPKAVFLELCCDRRSVLLPQDKMEEPSVAELVNDWKKNPNFFGLFVPWFSNKMACKLKISHGGEFRVAYEEAMKYGACVYLGDRNMEITMQRTWAKMSLWYKTKFMLSGLFYAVFFPSKANLTEMVKESDDDIEHDGADSFPSLEETILHERDQFMSAKLLEVSRKHKSVVAVIGGMHLSGIQKHWEQPIDLEKLLSIPSEKRRKPKPAGEIRIYIGATVAGVAMAFIDHNS